MKKLIFISTIILSIFDYPDLVGIVTFIPFLAFAVWMACTFWPKVYVNMWHIVLKDLLRR